MKLRILFIVLSNIKKMNYMKWDLFLSTKNRSDISKEFMIKLEEQECMNMKKYIDNLGGEIYENCMRHDLKFIKDMMN